MGPTPSRSLATLAHCEVSHIPPENLRAEATLECPSVDGNSKALRAYCQGTGMWTRQLGAAYNDAKAVRSRSAKEWKLAHKR